MEISKNILDNLGVGAFHVEQSAAMTTSPLTNEPDKNGLYLRKNKTDGAIVYTNNAPDSFLLEHMVIMHCDIHNINFTTLYPKKEDEEKPGKTCPLCVKERDSKRKTEEKERDRLAMIEAYVSNAGVPKRFILDSFDSYITTYQEQETAKRIIKEYASDIDSHLKTGKSMLLLGKSGTGKTHLSISVIRELAIRNMTSKYITAMQYIRMIRESWKSKTRIESDIIKNFGEYQLVVLDEVGVQCGTDNEANIISELIDERYKNVKPTIVITNETLETLKTFLNERTLDRLTDNGGILIPFSWKSYRRTRTA